MGLINTDGNPLQKLVRIINKAVGTVHQPNANTNKNEKQSKIDAIVKAKSLASEENNEFKLSSLQRIEERLIHQEQRKQNNIESVSQIAFEQLSQENIISNEPVNDDWSTRFFNIIEDISDEEMQKLWGRILANEVKQPKSFSLRTLELVKNLTKEEADLFTKFANLRITDGKDHFVINPNNGDFLKDEFNITFSDKLLLTELGLIVSESDLQFSFLESKENNTKHLLIYGDKTIIFQRPVNTPTQHCPVLVLTKAGIELSKLINQNVNIKYIEKVCSIFKRPTVKIEYGNLVNINGYPQLIDSIQYS